ncbi:MAG TPA: tRNA uridine-5-carboxymethylaminomethyl(34) synthesis GTPase MnmE, partial [Spirochaetia bacterium]|nr:tRNA uridine-5-carboxymethylaminomethyl(34) synthesis GTPase MnmE [Spirochaetia bacterium]
RIGSMFSPEKRLTSAEPNTIVVGTILSPADRAPIDQVMAAVYRAPKSYTGQDGVEIFCHGSRPGITMILKALRRAGFRDASPGEFTFRAFMNRKMDLTRAEAVAEIVSARTERAQELALKRLSGALEARIRSIRDRILGLLSAMEIQLDYPEDEIESPLPDGLLSVQTALSDIAEVLSTYKTGRLYRDGIRAAIAGRTNAGKSSLFNLMVNEDRSIVSEMRGTTRDYIESWVSVSGIPVCLIDTAGLRPTDNPVEIEGIRRSERIIASADIVLYLVDGSEGIHPEDTDTLKRLESRPLIRVWNKIDMTDSEIPKGFVPVSSVSGEGLPFLYTEISRILLEGSLHPKDDLVIDSERQRDLLLRASEALSHVSLGLEGGVPLDAVAMDVREALDALGEIVGEVSEADMLTDMFSRFCVGK